MLGAENANARSGVANILVIGSSRRAACRAAPLAVPHYVKTAFYGRFVENMSLHLVYDTVWNLLPRLATIARCYVRHRRILIPPPHGEPRRPRARRRAAPLRRPGSCCPVNTSTRSYAQRARRASASPSRVGGSVGSAFRARATNAAMHGGGGTPDACASMISSN
jgi:hypothetical protein